MGNLSKEGAKSAYVDHLSKARPGWEEEDQRDGKDGQSGKKHKGSFGPVFSTMATATGEEETDEGGKQVGVEEKLSDHVSSSFILVKIRFE